jgi:hypothetical protein
MSWQIFAVGDHYHSVSEPLPELKALTQAATGKAFRRIGRFIQLALIGAARCAGQQSLPKETAVYLSSGRGDLELTLEIMTQLFRDGQTPKPLNFVNTVANAACFYLAQHLGLHSRSNFVGNRYFAFESVLQLAALDLSRGVVDSALVGGVDIATAPLAQHRHRLQLPIDAPIGEGSHWLWLGRIDPRRPRAGELVAARHFVDRESLLDWIREQSLSHEHCRIAAGQFVQADDFAAIQVASGLKNTFAARTPRGHYDSHSGGLINEFLSRAALGDSLLHVNADNRCRYCAILVER